MAYTVKKIRLIESNAKCRYPSNDLYGMLLNVFFIFRAFEIAGREQKETENKPQVRCTIRIL
jgi:hypothetical protein